MGKSFIWIIVVLTLASVSTLSEAACGSGPQNCSIHADCAGIKKACLSRGAAQKKCLPCPCDDPSECELLPGKGINTKCNCPLGLTGGVCDCPLTQDPECGSYTNDFVKIPGVYLHEFTPVYDTVVEGTSDCLELCLANDLCSMFDYMAGTDNSCRIYQTVSHYLVNVMNNIHYTNTNDELHIRKCATSL